MAKLILSTILFAALLLTPFRVAGQARILTVMVIDTGIDPAVGHLCKQGHKDLTLPPKQQLVKTPSDSHGHGSHVAGLIVANAQDSNYCIVSVKYYNEHNTGIQNLNNTIAALRYALNIKVDYVNYSGGGPEANETEKALIKALLDRGTKVVVAAGNEKHDLTKDCNYYPACYDSRLTVVGNLETYDDFRNLDDVMKELGRRAGIGHLINTYKTRRAPSSNYGSQVTRWEIGMNLRSNLPGGRYGYMSGTSQATGVATGKIIKENDRK